MSTYDTIHIYATKGVRKKLETLAEMNKRSMSAQIQVLIETEFEKVKAKNETQSSSKRRNRNLL